MAYCVVFCSFQCLGVNLQGLADEGTPPRDMGDTYSQSTDPSDDEDPDRGVHNDSAAGPSNRANSSHDVSEGKNTRGARSASHGHTSPSPSAQPAQQHESLQQEASVTLDTQHDPAEDADMQEGEPDRHFCQSA